MAQFHFDAKPVSRGGGRSATAAAAYRAGVEIVDQRTGVIHDYTRKGGVLYSELVLPGGGTADRAEFWNSVELHHKRGDAVVAREVVVALPFELNAEQQRELLRHYTRELADRYGVAVDLAQHDARDVTDDELKNAPDRFSVIDPETGRRHNGNMHAHLLMAACLTAPDGALGRKAEALDPIACRRAKGGPLETLVDRERPRWAELVNGALERAGRPERVDHRSLADQRAAALAAGDLDRAAELDRVPTIHEGPRVTQIRRECEAEQRPPLGNVVRLEINNAARQINADRAELRGIEAEIIQLEDYRAARAAELAELVGAEQADHQDQLADIEHGQALLANVHWYRAQISALEGRGASKPSREVIEAQRRKEAAQQAQAEAKRAAADAEAWRAAHPLRAAIQDQLGIPPATDRAADEAQAAARAAAARYKRFSGLPEARQWVDDNRALRALQERLPAVERAAGIEPQAERDARARAALDEARRLLRRAAGRVDNELTRATRDEARELFELRREIEAKLTEIEGQPELSEAERLQAAAVQYQERAEGWRAAANARQADAKQAAPSDHQERAQPRPDDDPRPRNRGPRLG